MKKIATLLLILGFSLIYFHACSKSKEPAKEETPVPEPKPDEIVEMKPENYPNLVWIYDKNRWKHDTYNGGEAKYVWTNEKNTPENLTLEVTTTRGSVCSNSWIQIVLKPNTVYRFSTEVRTLGVTGDKGATITLVDEWWSTASYVKGTQQKTTIYRTFLTDNSGIARLCICLGVNGATSSGTAYFSNMKVEDANYTTIESKYMRLRVRDEHAKVVSENTIKEWLSKLDNVYDEYIDLVGADPWPNVKTNVYSPDPSITAWGYAGNPIQVTLNGIAPMLRAYQDNKDWSFGMMHEIGHNFNSGGDKFNNSDAEWNWNDEMFANFRMYYAMEKLNARFSQSKIYEGSGAEMYYKTDASESYDKMFPTGKYSHDALMYTLIRVKNQIGWEPFKKLFREFYNNRNPSGYSNWQRFERFLNTLNKYSNINVWETYTQSELDIIKNNI
jgi:hypothetical protein